MSSENGALFTLSRGNLQQFLSSMEIATPYPRNPLVMREIASLRGGKIIRPSVRNNSNQ